MSRLDLRSNESNCMYLRDLAMFDLRPHDSVPWYFMIPSHMYTKTPQLTYEEEPRFDSAYIRVMIVVRASCDFIGSDSVHDALVSHRHSYSITYVRLRKHGHICPTAERNKPNSPSIPSPAKYAAKHKSVSRSVQSAICCVFFSITFGFPHLSP